MASKTSQCRSVGIPSGTRMQHGVNLKDGPEGIEVETADKPGSVVGDHPSWTHVAMRL